MNVIQLVALSRAPMRQVSSSRIHQSPQSVNEIVNGSNLPTHLLASRSFISQVINIVRWGKAECLQHQISLLRYSTIRNMHIAMIARFTFQIHEKTRMALREHIPRKNKYSQVTHYQSDTPFCQMLYVSSITSNVAPRNHRVATWPTRFALETESISSGIQIRIMLKI